MIPFPLGTGHVLERSEAFLIDLSEVLSKYLYVVIFMLAYRMTTSFVLLAIFQTAPVSASRGGLFALTIVHVLSIVNKCPDCVWY